AAVRLARERGSRATASPAEKRGAVQRWATTIMAVTPNTPATTISKAAQSGIPRVQDAARMRSETSAASTTKETVSAATCWAAVATKRPGPTRPSASPTSPARGAMTTSRKATTIAVPIAVATQRARSGPRRTSAVGFDPVPGPIAEASIVGGRHESQATVIGQDALQDDRTHRRGIEPAAGVETRVIVVSEPDGRLPPAEREWAE